MILAETSVRLTRKRITSLLVYSVLGGGLVNRLIVAPDLERVFDYRQERLRSLFEYDS